MKKKKNELTFEDRKKIMDKYHSGNEELREQAIEEMLDALDEYVYYMIHRRFSGYLGIIDDLVQSGRLAIIEHMGRYNPEYKLTTFFSFHIQNALQDVVNKENGESHYYAESKNIVVKTIRSLGMDFENIDEQVLAMHLDMSTSRLHSILEKTLYKKKVELIEEDGQTVSSFCENPETVHMQNETQQEFRACIAQLDEVEQIVLCMFFGFYHEKFNPYEITFKLNEIQKALDEAGYSVNAINEYRAARRHITDIIYKAGLVGKRNKYQSAKDEIGLKFNDKEAADEMFEALSELDP